ncbi:ribonuclease H-like domain-containing protein [Tanacetum coccineum]
MTKSTKDMIDLVDVSYLTLIVGYPNETLAKITHVGNLKLSNDVMLFDVLVVPEYCVSLLSVQKLIRDSKLSVGFDKTKCYIQDLKRGRVLGTHSELGDLYLFDREYNKSVVGNKSKFFAFHVSKEIWHCRLGHPANQVFHKAKQTRDSFPLSENKSTVLGELIHLDVWGPYQVVIMEGFRYFLNVVDEVDGKSPFSLVYGREPNLSHLGSFDRLCFATVFKSVQNEVECDSSKSDVINLNFFDFIESETTTNAPNSRPTDDEEGPSGKDGIRLDMMINTLQLLYVRILFEGTVFLNQEVPVLENIEVPVFENMFQGQKEEASPGLRRSSRSSKLLAKLNVYVLDTKSFEPSSFEEDSKDINWIGVMKDEMHALYENDTWYLTDLPAGRKLIGSKWVFRIKYKSNGEIERKGLKRQKEAKTDQKPTRNERDKK